MAESAIQDKEFPNIITDIIKAIVASRIAETDFWMNGVDIMHDTTIPYHDDYYLKKHGELTKAFNIKVEEERGLKKKSPITEIRYYRKLYRELIALVGRAGFLPIGYIDGVIEEEDLRDEKPKKDGKVDKGPATSTKGSQGKDGDNIQETAS